MEAPVEDLVEARAPMEALVEVSVETPVEALEALEAAWKTA